jgi:hypothetical protein
MAQAIRGSLIDTYGRPISGVSILVKLNGTETPASLYSDKALTQGIGNPVTSEADGSYLFYAVNGSYDLVFTKAGFTFDATDSVDEICFDGPSHVSIGTHPASAITNVPAGGIAATNVQAAINELDTEKLSVPIPNNTALYLKDSGGTPQRAILWTLTDTIYFGDIDRLLSGRIGLSGAGENALQFTTKEGVDRVIWHQGNDGAGSGLDADMVDNKHASDFFQSSNTPTFTVGMTGDQTVSSGVQTKITLNSEQFDTNNNFDPVTNYRFTPTVAGKYLLSGILSATGATTLTNVTLYLSKNGSYTYLGCWQGSLGASGGVTISGSTIISANGSADYFELIVLIVGTGTLKVLAVSTLFSGCRVNA